MPTAIAPAHSWASGRVNEAFCPNNPTLADNNLVFPTIFTIFASAIPFHAVAMGL